jgi:hypothetical protein
MVLSGSRRLGVSQPLTPLFEPVVPDPKVTCPYCHVAVCFIASTKLTSEEGIKLMHSRQISLATSVQVATDGTIVHQPENPIGIVIVDERDHNPVLYIGEKSDDDRIKILLDVNRMTRFIDNTQTDTESASQYEIHAKRADLADKVFQTPDW